MRAPVDTTAWTLLLSIILQMNLPVFAIVIAPESVRTTLQAGSLTIAAVTSSASPRLRPLKAVRDMPRRREENEVTASRSRLSRGTRPSSLPSWNSRCLLMRNPRPDRIIGVAARTEHGVSNEQRASDSDYDRSCDSTSCAARSEERRVG